MAFHCVRCEKEIDKSYKACPHCGEPITDFQRTYSDALVDGKYQIEKRLGAGGMGEVYKVTHAMLGATRVIKVIRPQISENKDAHERFLKEARIATRIHHPNVATLHDFAALPDGSHYMVWEYIDGEDVAKRIRARGRLQPRYAVRLAIEALHGLDGIHRVGIVHRDISPENIMITRDGDEERVKVIDLGVAKSEDPGENATRVGMFVGKLRYASPEHLGFLEENERIDGRADLYSMAMVLYEMLTGRPPFEATSPHEYVMLHSRETAFKPLDLPPDLPGGEELQAVLKKGLERDRNKRFANAREFVAALERVEQTLPNPNTQETAMNVALGGLPTHMTPALTSPDALHRTTMRSEVRTASDATIVATPIGSSAAPAAATLIGTPIASAATQHDIIARPRKGGGMGLVLGIVALLAVGTIVAVLLMMRKQGAQTSTTDTAAKPPVVAQTTTTAAPPLNSTVDILAPAPTQTITELTTTTETAAPVLTASMTPAPTATFAQTPPVRPAQQGNTTPAPRPETQPSDVEPPTPAPSRPAGNVRTYIDGDLGDSEVNESIISEARRQLGNVTRVSVRSNDPAMKSQLVDRLGKDTSLTVSDSADTVIDWDATYIEMGRGRKRRAANATVIKNGRVVFRYELPSEEYRVGDTPAEAFARVLANALGQ